jgi:WG containing repeat
MRTLLFIFLLLLPIEGMSQEAAAPLFRVWDSDGKEGFIDINGNAVSKPREEVRDFREGLAPVKVGDKWGYVDIKGRVAIAPRWKTYNIYNAPVMPFFEGLAAVYDSPQGYSSEDEEYQTYNCGYIDKAGEYVIKPVRRQGCGEFHDGLAVVKVDPRGPEKLKTVGETGYIDTKGNLAIAPKYFEAGDFIDGYALVGDDWENYPRPSTYLIDKNGNKATGVKDCRWRYQFFEGLALAFSAKEKRYDGYVNEKCEYVIKLPADLHAEPGLSYFSQGLAAVYKQRPLLPNEESYSANRPKTYGFIDKTGKIALPLQYKDAAPFSDGFAVVGRELDSDSYIDLQGRPVFEGRIGGTASFKNGLAFQILFIYTISEKPNARNIYGYMNRQGKYVWLAPGAEVHLEKEWIEKNYIGPQKF